MKNLRDKFIENGIPYDDIDPEMIDILDVLNFHLGLKTQFCCYGHDDKTRTHVIFDKVVTDEMIYNLAEQSGQSYMQINFNKWVRHYPVMTNWFLELGVSFKDPNDALKRIHLDNVVECLRGCKAV